MLLQHVNDSLAALHEGIATGYIGPGPADPAAGDPAAGLVATFRDRACKDTQEANAGGRKAAEMRAARLAPPPGVLYNRPDTGPGARARKRTDVGR